jgi:hypothetical protein
MYVGKIRQLESISNNRKLASALDQSIINFQDYWTSGFNPYVGKDIVTPYPTPPEGHRHVHILPVIFPTRNEIKLSNKLKYTDSKACWDSWAKNTDDSEFISSNEDLIKYLPRFTIVTLPMIYHFLQHTHITRSFMDAPPRQLLGFLLLYSCSCFVMLSVHFYL